MEQNKEFVWTDETVIEFFEKESGQTSLGRNTKKAMIDNFKKSKEVKPTVSYIKVENNHVSYDIFYNGEGVSANHNISAERLAEILIAESKGDLNLNGNTRIKFQPIESSDPDFNRYNEKELIEAEEKAFNMARSVYPHKYVYAIKDWQYKTFSDYKNQQSNK